VLLAVNLPLSSVLAGLGVLALGGAWYALRSARR
jgi:basic amino acid/polyamine antiporter, APA family